MAAPEIRHGMRSDANLFTRSEIGRYLRRFKMHLQAGASDSVVNLACEIREEIEQRKNADPDSVYLESVIEDERIVSALDSRGIITIGDVLRAGDKLIKYVFRNTESSYRRVREVCDKYQESQNFE